MPGPEQGYQRPQMELGQAGAHFGPVSPGWLGPEFTPAAKPDIDPLRTRTPKPPLTPAEINYLAAHRGQPVTTDQIRGMNAARAAGIHTSIV